LQRILYLPRFLYFSDLIRGITPPSMLDYLFDLMGFM
jgi:hypothetical protein